MQAPPHIIPRIGDPIQSLRGHCFRAFFVFGTVLAVFLATPAGRLSDGRFTLLLAESLLVHGTANLAAYLREPPPEGHPLRTWKDADNLLQRGHALYHLFPPGGAVLSVPYVAVTRALGVKVIDDFGHYDEAAEEAAQGWLAALLGAATAAAWFLLASRFMPAPAAFGIAIVAALASPLWSLLSQTLWPDTWGVFLLSGLLLALVGPAPVSNRRIAVAAVLAVALLFIKPLYLVSSAVAFGATVGQRRGMAVRGTLAALVLLAMAWLLAQQVLPFYYSLDRLAWGDVPSRLAGVLFSPGRGWFVYMPVTIVLLARACAGARARVWAMPALLAIAVHMAVVALFPHWWGGHGYGPRLLAASLPWWVMLAALAFPVRVRPFAALLLVVGLALHARGALSPGPHRWNTEPVDVDRMPARVWDARVPPFLADLVPDRLYPGVPLYMTAGGAPTFLGEGWRPYGGKIPLESLAAAGMRMGADYSRDWRWTDGHEATLRLHAVDLRGRTLTFTAIPYVVPGGPERQRVHVLVGDHEIGSSVLRRLAPQAFSVQIPGDLPGGLVEVRLALPDAVGPGLFVLKMETN
jgi:hypothetical protein